MAEANVIVADNGDQVSLKLKDLIQAEADTVLKSSDTSILVIGLSGSTKIAGFEQGWWNIRFFKLELC